MANGDEKRKRANTTSNPAKPASQLKFSEVHQATAAYVVDWKTLSFGWANYAYRNDDGGARLE